MRYFTIFILLLLSTLSLVAKDIWYKTDFPENEQVKQFSTFGNFILTESGKIYVNDNQLHWELIYDAVNDTIPNSIWGVDHGNPYDNWDDIYYNYKIYVGTNKGIFTLSHKTLKQFSLPGINTQPAEVLGEYSYQNNLYFSLGGKGLYTINMETNKIDRIDYFDSIPYKNITCRDRGLRLFVNNNEIYDIGDDNSVLSYKKIETNLSDINDASGHMGDYTATKNGFYQGQGNLSAKNLEGKNCIQIAVVDFMIVDGIYDPNRIDTVFYYATPFVATEKNGVYFIDYPFEAYPINGGLEDTNMTHIAIHQDFKLVASTKSGGVYKTANVLIAGIKERTQDQIIISPNPVQNTISISSSENTLLAAVQIYDIFGNMVLETIGNQSSELSVDLSALPAGTYYCKAVIGGKIVVKKIMKI